MRMLLFFSAILWFSTGAFAQCDNLKPMYGDKCVKSAKMKKADEAFKKAAIKQNVTADSAANVYLRLGWRHFADRDAETAMKRFNQAWLLDPQNPSVYFAFGHLTRYAFSKNAPEAEKYYKLGRDRDPKHIKEPQSMGILLTALDLQQNLEAAIDASSQLVQGFPDFQKGFGFKKRTYYYIQARDIDRALTDAEEALKRDPTDANNYVARGFAFMWKDANEKALADYNQAIAINKNFAPAYGNRAQLYFEKMNQPESALTDVNKALQLEPKDSWYHKLKSEILFKLNRPDEACQSLKNGMLSGNKSLEEDYKAKCGSKK